MAENVAAFQKCANCGACSAVCPAQAITVLKSNYYYSPKVDPARCVGCGKCALVCPVNRPERAQHLVAAYAGYFKDDAVLRKSSSGGAFYALAQEVLRAGGVVFGAAFSPDQKAVVFSSTDEVPLESLQKSKYVESSVGQAFGQVKGALAVGRRVLFCGTPCQAAGLKRFLGADPENLLVCDFSCGGLPSHKIYADYLTALEERHGSAVKTVDFRPKSFGWDEHALRVQFKNGRVYNQLATLDPYYRGFLKSLTKRDYCYACDFADNHYADIMLADFWLYKKLSRLENENKGLSLILTNSPKGEQAVLKIKSSMHLEQLELSKAAYNIKCGHQSQAAVNRHKAFMAAVKSSNFVAAVNKFDPLSVPYKVKQQVRKWVKKVK